jgi:isopentenyl diphosphate isomerase/L-lactate dehydrogenase-like FMN-dependent dehydrogenase
VTRAGKLRSPVSIRDLRALAKAKLPAEVFNYIDCGAGHGSTCRANRRDLKRISLLPLTMRDVAAVDLATPLLGHSFRLPIGIGPTAFHRLVHPDGEVATANAAKARNAPMIVSAMSSIPLEDIAAVSGHPALWLQSYFFRDREATDELIERAARAGYQAVVMSAGCPVVGKREQSLRNRFALPADVLAANFSRTNAGTYDNPIEAVPGIELDAAATWRDVEELCRRAALPVVVKGVMHPRDAVRAMDSGAAGLIVSNHGGRQLDSTASTIATLPEVVAAVSGRVPLLVDGGFRRGTDVLKALALGAVAVLLGRPALWALAVDGERGVVQALDMLADELHRAMQLVGFRTIAELSRGGSDILRIPDLQ